MMHSFWFKKIKCFSQNERKSNKTKEREREKREKIFFLLCLLHARILHLSLYNFFLLSYFTHTNKKHTEGLELYLYINKTQKDDDFEFCEICEEEQPREEEEE